MTGEPADVNLSIEIRSPVRTSGERKVRSGEISQPKSRAQAMVAPTVRFRHSSETYPKSPRSAHPTMKSRTSGAMPRSISASHIPMASG